MRSRRHVRVLFVIGMITVLAALLHCVRGGGDADPAATTAPAAAPSTAAGGETTLAADTTDEARADTARADTTRPDAARPDAARPDAATALQPAPTKNPVATMMRSTNDADRTLLSTVERQTQAAPPPALLQLLSLRDAGKSRAELDRFINERLGADLRVQLAAKRWLRTSFGDAPAPASPLPGHGGGPRRMQAPVAQ